MGVPFSFGYEVKMRFKAIIKRITAAMLFTIMMLFGTKDVMADVIDTSFKGTGDDYLTFRSYLTFEIYDEVKDPEHRKVLATIEMKKAEKAGIDGIFYLADRYGNKFITYKNSGDYSVTTRLDKWDQTFYNYLYELSSVPKCEKYFVQCVPVIKVYSRDNNHVGPYNGNGWRSWNECDTANFAVTLNGTETKNGQPGKDRFGTPLGAGNFNLNDVQIGNIYDIYDISGWTYTLTAEWQEREIKYFGNGGKIGGKDKYEGTFEVGHTDVISVDPVHSSGYYFWGWSEKQYAVNKGPTDYDAMLHAGDPLPFWDNAKLYAVWGTCALSDVDDGHIHNFKKKRTASGDTCPICGGRLYEITEICSCGEIYDIYDAPHTCPESRIIYRSGDCRVCHDFWSPDNILISSGNTQTVKSVGDAGFSARGHYFAGWCDDTTGNGRYYSVGETVYFDGPGQTLELFAIWAPLSYRIHFDYMEEGLYGSENLIKGETEKTVSIDDFMGDLPEGELYGYAFVGWYSPDNGIMMDGTTRYALSHDSTFEAVWKGHIITITADPSFPSGAENCKNSEFLELTDSLVQIPFGEMYADYMPVSAVPKCDGYTFLGWQFPDGTMLDETKRNVTDSDQVVRGVWEVKRIELVLDPGAGSFEGSEEGEVLRVTRTYGEMLTGDRKLPVPEREGYQFGGWFMERDGQGERAENGEKLTIPESGGLYAKWIARKSLITFDYCENWKYPAKDLVGNDIKKTVVTYGEMMHLPEPERYGYRFVGWSTSHKYDEDVEAYVGSEEDMIPTDGFCTIKDNTTVYAVWKALKVKVTYDFNYDYTEEIPLPGSGR